MASLPSKIILYVGREVDFFREVVLQDDMIDRISSPYIRDWNIQGIAKPTMEQLSSFEIQADTLESNLRVIDTRRSLYGPSEKQLEYIVENGLEAFIARQLQIKSDNPKG